jgi:hypothetical protein
MSVPNLVYIPTKGRTQAQPTRDSFPDDLKAVTLLVCPPEEVEIHERLGRRAVACDAKGISAVRQWICENADTRAAIMCDDDHKWFVRADPEKYNLRPTTSREVGRLFSDIRSLLVTNPLVGVSRRQHNNAHFPDLVKYVTRQCNVHGVDVEFLSKHDIRWDILPLMEDFHVTLSVLNLGVRNAMIVDRAWDQTASNAARMLRDRWPEYVQLVKKTNKTGWDGMTTRTDVRVSWKRAYEDGKGAE